MARRSSSKDPAKGRKKLFYKIGEVCELTSTEPYLLRWWEQEFPFLAPEKNTAGHRIYTDEDIQTVLEIKRLLYEEGYTTAGARRRLEREREEGVAQQPEPAAAPGMEAAADRLVATLKRVTSELTALRGLLATPGGQSGAARATPAGVKGSKGPSSQAGGGPARKTPAKKSAGKKASKKKATGGKTPAAGKKATGKKAAGKRSAGKSGAGGRGAAKRKKASGSRSPKKR